MAAEEEEEGGGEVTLGGVQVQAQPRVKKEKVRDRVCEDCCPLVGHFGSTLPLLPMHFVLFPSEAEELGSRELDIGNKKIYIDLRLNDQGKFVRIVEVSRRCFTSALLPHARFLPFL